MANVVQTVSSPAESNVYASDYPVRVEGGTLLSGQDLAAMVPVVIDATTKKWKAAVSTDVAAGIMVAAVDASAADAPCLVYRSGDFLIDKVEFVSGLDTTIKKVASLAAPLFVTEV